MQFYRWFIKNCSEKGVSPSKAAVDGAGVSSAAATGWKHGAVPSPVVVERLEQYFGEKFNGENTENKKSPTAEAAELDEDTITILNLLGKLTPSNRDRAIAYLQGLVAGQS